VFAYLTYRQGVRAEKQANEDRLERQATDTTLVGLGNRTLLATQLTAHATTAQDTARREDVRARAARERAALASAKTLVDACDAEMKIRVALLMESVGAVIGPTPPDDRTKVRTTED
jgi:hypothetical protein